MYGSMHTGCDWTNLVKDIYYAINDCSTYTNRRTSLKHKRSDQILLETKPLKLFIMSILRPPFQALKETPYVVLITDTCSEIEWAFRTGQVMTTSMAWISLHNWIIPYAISTHIIKKKQREIPKRNLCNVKHTSRNKANDHDPLSVTNHPAGGTV